MPGADMERVASLFMNNRSQAVRIPKEFELPGSEVSIIRQSDGSLVIRPVLRLAALVASFDPLAADDALGEIPELPVEDVTL
jgi:antitoxin VapB